MKIGELAAVSGATPKTIRFYEEAGVLPEPARTLGGYRNYGADAVDRLAFIGHAQAAGLSLRQIRQILAIHDGGNPPCAHVRNVLTERLDDVRAQMAELITLETHLEMLLARGQESRPTEHDNGSICWILEAETPTPTGAAMQEPASTGHIC
ncbi:MAG: heavy metal-responsive transcriptional regulator [Actinobacteria bacterium 69-20]|nr:heavy metal-responsive transcriptional regulator [Actinomycetota bacterium]OJV28089.1 MAG: heavy metal-responsive transcriptional regulator [Actinobacteria bacterium 69-20]